MMKKTKIHHRLKMAMLGALLLNLTGCGAGKSEPAATEESTTAASAAGTLHGEENLLSESKTFSEDASEEDTLEVLHTDDGELLVRNGETVFGPCRYIDYGYEGSSERYRRYFRSIRQYPKSAMALRSLPTGRTSRE